MTVIGRRSAKTSGPLGDADFGGEAGTSEGGFAPANAAIASSNRSRSPRAKTPRSLRSSPVSRGSRSASILLSRKLASYWPRPRPRSHPPTSMALHLAWQEDHSVTANCPAERPTLIMSMRAVLARAVKECPLRAPPRPAAFRPTEASTGAVRYVRNTSTPDIAADRDLVRVPPEASAPVRPLSFEPKPPPSSRRTGSSRPYRTRAASRA